MFICTGLSCTTTCTCPPLKVLLSTQKQKQVPYYFYLIPQQQGLALPSTRTVPRNPLEQIQRIPFLAPTHASLQKHKGIPLVCSHRMQGIPHTHMLISYILAIFKYCSLVRRQSTFSVAVCSPQAGCTLFITKSSVKTKLRVGAVTYGHALQLPTGGAVTHGHAL